MAKAPKAKSPISLRDRSGAPSHIGTVGIFGHRDAPGAASRALAKARGIMRQYWPHAQLQRPTLKAFDDTAKQYLAKRELFQLELPSEQQRQIKEICDRADALLNAIDAASKVAGHRLDRRVKKPMGMELRKHGSKDHDAQGFQELIVRFRDECEKARSDIAAISGAGRLPIEHVSYLSFALAEQWHSATG